MKARLRHAILSDLFEEFMIVELPVGSSRVPLRCGETVKLLASTVTFMRDRHDPNLRVSIGRLYCAVKLGHGVYSQVLQHLVSQQFCGRNVTVLL